MACDRRRFCVTGALPPPGCNIRAEGNVRGVAAQDCVKADHSRIAEMLLRRKQRPNTAGGKLETVSLPSILTKAQPVGRNAQRLRTKGLWDGSAPQGGRAALWDRDHKGAGQRPEWLEKELLKEEHRRHSVIHGSISTSAKGSRNRLKPMSTVFKRKIEEKVSLDNLMSLKLAFEEMEQGGRKWLDLHSFRLIVKKCLGLRGINNEQIQELFMKIDNRGYGVINWDDFCTYMQLEYAEKEESLARSREACFALPARIQTLPHGEPVLRIRSTPDGNVQERPVNRKPKWATDCVIMAQYNKLIVGTGDREIQLYEISSLEPYCQIGGLETVPLTIDYCCTGHDECVLVYGDAQGCVTIISVTLVGETLRLWKKSPKIENMPSTSLDSAALSAGVKLYRWRVHDDWVNEVKYFQSIRAIISTSSHEHAALVIGCLEPSVNFKQQSKELQDFQSEGKPRKVAPSPGCAQQREDCDQTVFSIYKGVKAFDFSKERCLLVTGGLDRLIRTWNPYVPGRPTGMMAGHSAPISYLCISSEENQIISVSMDSNVKIWDIHEQSCLVTVHPKASLIDGDISACHYFSSVRALYVATDSIARLSLHTKQQPLGHLLVSHREPVLCCRYSREFRQVVSCSEGSVVKVWDLDTGSQVFEFGGAHDQYAITCMTFDPKGRRLVTGGRDGCLKVWNFNNGQCLKVFRKEGKRSEVCDCTYLTVNRNSFVISVGWDRHVDTYSDSPEDLHHLQSPQPPWADDLNFGHTDDILCVTHCAPSLLATGSYNGEILVWGIFSGHIQSRLQTPLPPDTSTTGMNVSVLSLVFLKTQATNVEHDFAPCLVSSGLQGYVHFWNIKRGGRLLASFEASRQKCQITKLCVTGEDRWLYAADDVGYIYVFDIKTYGHGPTEPQTRPATVNFWRAHVSTVTSLQVVDEEELLLTSSADCTVRLWSVNGELIGTFGQPEIWSLHTPASWRYPRVPVEVLSDPLSMPSLPQLEEISLSNASHANMELHSRLGHPPLSDKAIREEMDKPWHPAERGKRLRHVLFQNNNKQADHGGPKDYHTLKCFELGDVPTAPPKPDLSLAGMDPFMSSIAEHQATPQ